MSKVRKSHSNEIIDRRLRQYEVAGAVDAMELIGLHDELSRIERKLLEKLATFKPDGRPLPNLDQHNARFDRLAHLIDAAVRQLSESPERLLLVKIVASLHERTPLSQPS